jgi:hypothetical protein
VKQLHRYIDVIHYRKERCSSVHGHDFLAKPDAKYNLSLESVVGGSKVNHFLILNQCSRRLCRTLFLKYLYSLYTNFKWVYIDSISNS